MVGKDTSRFFDVWAFFEGVYGIQRVPKSLTTPYASSRKIQYLALPLGQNKKGGGWNCGGVDGGDLTRYQPQQNHQHLQNHLDLSLALVT